MVRFFFCASLWSTSLWAVSLWSASLWATFAPIAIADDGTVLDAAAVDGEGLTPSVVVKEGQQYILLNSDGTWSNVTDGGFAVASDGTRIRLDADGKWHFVASLPVARADAQTLPATGERSSNSPVLVKVEVLKKQRKRAKSTHTDTRTVFHLSVLNVSGKALKSDQQLAAKISVQTSTGRNLEVESISFVPTTIEPGVSGQVRVVADGSPRWFGVKRLELLMAPHALGNIQQQRLAIDMADVEFKFVDNF